MSYQAKYDHNLRKWGIQYSATANGLLAEADKEIEAKESEIQKAATLLSKAHLKLEAKDKLIDELYAKLIRLTKDIK